MRFTFVAAQSLTLATETCKPFIGMVAHIKMGGIGVFCICIINLSSELVMLYLTCHFSFCFVYRNIYILAV